MQENNIATVAARLRNNIGLLPNHGVSKTQNPGAFLDIIKDIIFIYKTVFSKLKTLKVNYGIDPVSVEVATKASKQDRAPPESVEKENYIFENIIPSRDQAVDARDSLVAGLLEKYSVLAINYRILNTKDERLSEHIIMLISMLDVYIVALMPQETRKNMEAISASESDYLRKNDLVKSPRPVLHYLMSNLMQATYQLCARWNTLRFSTELLGYLELLRVRMGHFLHWTFPGWVHDVDALRVVITYEDKYLPVDQTDWEFQSGPAVRSLFTCMLTAILKKLSYLSIGEIVEFEQHTEPLKLSDYGIDLDSPMWRGATILDSLDEAHSSKTIKFLNIEQKTDGLIIDRVINQDQCLLFKRWIEYRLHVMMCDSGSNLLKKEFLTKSLRPGEYESFVVQNRDAVPTVHNILRKFRGPEFFKLWDQADRTIPDVIESEFDLHPEPLSLTLVLTELLTMYMGAEFFPLKWNDYVIYDTEWEDRQTDPSTLDDIPCIVQIFNHFQLYYKGKVYRVDSYIRATLMWMYIVDKVLNRTVKCISLEKWYKELADIRCGKIQKAKSTKKKNNKKAKPKDGEEGQVSRNKSIVRKDSSFAPAKIHTFGDDQEEDEGLDKAMEDGEDDEGNAFGSVNQMMTSLESDEVGSVL